ncbi:hypothetical protein LXL04_003230 [Taraxacum kok-saghyz]
MNKSDMRKASKHEDEADLISNLPDHVLLLILSGLPYTEEIIRTSILSRRWSMSTIERWIHAAVMRNVKQLDLSSPSQGKSENMVLPHCASLEVLSLCFRDRRLILPRFSGFPVLRVLKLMYFELLDGDTVADFLKSCPMLEDLTLDICSLDKLDGLCISCPKLKKLRIFECHLRGCFKINCPKLVFLDLTQASNFIFERLHSLKEARIGCKFKDIPGLFPGFFHVESLSTKLNFLYECIDGERDPALPNLKTLFLSTSDASTVKTLIQICKHSPKLESLQLTVEKDFDPMELGEMDVTETASVLTPDVKWVELFEINGEKPKLEIYWDPSEGAWRYLVATWGNK